MRVRSTCSTVENNILGILQKGFYDVLSKQDKNGYTWVETKKGQYTALILGYAELRPKEEVKNEIVDNIVDNNIEHNENIENKPDIDTKQEDNTNILEEQETSEKEQEKEEIKDNSTNGKANVLLWILETIYKLIKKLIKKN